MLPRFTSKIVAAHESVAAVIAPERCKDRKTPAGRAEQTAHQLALPCLIGRRRPVVGKAQLLRREPFLRKLFAACIVEQIRAAFFFLCHVTSHPLLDYLLIILRDERHYNYSALGYGMCVGCQKEMVHMKALQKQFDRQEFDDLNALVCG